MGFFSWGDSMEKTKQALRLLDSGESVAVRLMLDDVDTAYMIIREDKLREIAERAGCTLKTT